MQKRIRQDLCAHPSSRVRARRARGAALAAVLMLAVLALGACNSGSSSGSAGATGTGSVGVLFTDGPTDDFCGIPVTITEVLLLSDTGQVSIFQGRETVDLLELRDNTRLFTLGRDVPAGMYSKLRLVVEKIELEECDDNGNLLRTIPVRHSSNKIDLNPRGGFRVLPGELVLIQLDMDAEKCIKVTETGASDKYQFRPVVFVDIFTGGIPGRLVLLSGSVYALDRDARSFELCRTHAVSRPDDLDDDRRMTMSSRDMRLDDRDFDDDADDDRDSCVAIQVVDGTSFFDNKVQPASLDVIENGDAAAVLGRFVRDGERLRVQAETVQQGGPGTVKAFAGTVLSEVDPDDFFDFAIDPEQGVVTDENGIAVLLQLGTKIFSSAGEALEKSDIQPDRRARVVGAVDLTGADPQLNSTVVFLRVAPDGTERLAGVLVAWSSASRQLDLNTREGAPACAIVPADARVFRAHVEDGHIDFEPVDPADVPAGISVEIFGTSGDPCFDARTVIFFEGFDS
ncbi:MAG: DUF4382 domain-containing protein [Myxococcales bacterium]|nr:DUF4382 domain-containing protein [Myxococcales bacterium]MDH5567497.1 DUF4382 domain-containing protein [Myxococcales bacterium]